MFTIRTATIDDLPVVSRLELRCFPPAEAAPRETMADRMAHFADHFWILFDDDYPIGYVGGMVTDEVHLTDNLYTESFRHDENGRWQMIFSLAAVPEYRRRGCGAKLMNHAIKMARQQHRAGVVLTCKQEKISYYQTFGFVNEGLSTSEHGGATWCEMRLTLTSMPTFEEFSQMAEDEAALLPDYVHKELSGGVLIDPNPYLHPARLADDLYILGTYSVTKLGKQIVLYYGSFVRTLGYADWDTIRMQIQETLRHEFRHHLETRAGLFGHGTLIEEDRDRMRVYYMRHANNPDNQ